MSNKKVAKPVPVKLGATMRPVVTRVIPGSGGSAILDARPPIPNATQAGAPVTFDLPPASPMPLADLTGATYAMPGPGAGVDPLSGFLASLANGTGLSSSHSAEPGSQHADDVRTLDPRATNEDLRPVRTPIYQPDYQPLPARPHTIPVPAPPARDVRTESRTQDNARRLAQIVPILSLLTGGQGYTSALGRAPGQVAQGVAGATKHADNIFDESMQRYGIDRQNNDATNRDMLGEYLSSLQGVQEKNRQETARATQSRVDARASETAEEKRRADVIKAALAQTKDRQSFVTQMGALDPDTQQKVLSVAEQNGDLARLGIPADRDANGRYAFSVTRAAPPKTPVDSAAVAQKKAEAATKDRNARLRSEVTQSLAEYRDDHTTEPRRRDIEKRLQYIKTNVPDAWNGSVPRAGSRARLTPSQTDTATRARANNKKPAVDRVRISRLNAEVNDLQAMIANVRVDPALKAQAVARLQEITTKTGIGPHVKMSPGDFANMTPGQVASGARAASKEYNDAGKKAKILSVEEIP